MSILFVCFGLLSLCIDLVQDLYLSQLKAYKAPQKPADAHVGQVKTFKEPQAPSAPSVPSDLASELSAYDAAQPTFQQSASSSEVEHQQEGGDADSFLAFLEQDLPKDEVSLL